MEDRMAKFQISINRPPESQKDFIRALRQVGPIGLKQAVNLAIHFERFRNSVLVAGIDLPVAEHLASALRNAGAEVDLQASSVSTAMLCVPEVNAKYEWGAFRTIVKVA
jgi:hypothetical protein